jgi:hypothetical protein
MNRISVFLLNVVPGALLALVGAGILMADVHGLTHRRPVTEHRRPGAEGTSWHHGAASAPSREA